MDRNKVEIELLKKDPGKLLLNYQPVVWTIVRNYLSKGMVRYREQKDLVQEINKKLLERMPRIQAQYNYSSKLRTYFSVIIRNICLEENRRMNMVAEDPIPYLTTDASVDPEDLFLYRQEYERLQRILLLFNKERPRLNLLIKVFSNLRIAEMDLELFSEEISENEQNELIEELNDSLDHIRKRKFELVSQALTILEGKVTPPESLRKWYASRLEECLKLMNGHPPTSAYSADTLGLLLERVKILEKK